MVAPGPKGVGMVVSLAKLTKPLGISMENTKKGDDLVFVTKFHENELKYLNPGRLGRLAARDTGARAGPWPGP